MQYHMGWSSRGAMTTEMRSLSGSVHALRPFRARRLVVEGMIRDVEIWPGADGLGGYLLWVAVYTQGELVWRFLAHEDGAPLRFPDAIKAFEKAVNCQLAPGKLSVHWPPDRRRSPLED